jgi:asparagine synthase (glutamine-hydrolysing)
MCGICGLVTLNGEPDPARVDAMRDALVHRGPDEGSTDVLGRCALGHQRLRVIDLETGQQPVANETGDVVGVFNGEAYNFPELRAELAANGHEVRGTGDTPVLPHLYEEDGPGFVRRLGGMFALALWDASRERLVLARDRVGKKPLLWTRLPDGTLAFASELKALLRLPELPREVDLEAVDAYLALQYVPGEATALRGVRRLLPGHLLVAEGDSVRVERWWTLEPGRHAASSGPEWLELVRETVEAAVRRRLVADVPLGALLSGGIDSSVVVAAAARATTEPLRTFTVGFPDARYDERGYARAVAERYGTVHEEVEVEADVPETVQRLAETFDEPLGDEAAFPTFLISEQARRRVTVALTGDGGDEAFGGYERYAAMGLAGRLGRVPALPGLGARVLRRLPQAREPRSGVTRAARFLELAAAPAAQRYGRVMEVFPAELRRELWAEIEPRPAADLLGSPAEGVAGLQRLDVATYLPGDLLPKADLASMAHSLELRSPFLDHEVLELGLALPDGLKVRGRTGKVALRRAFAADLPPEVAGRGKTGFGVPLGRWFREDLRELAGDLLLGERARERGWFRPSAVERLLADHESRRAEHGHRLWCLLMLELWLRTHVESARPIATRPRHSQRAAG